MKVIVFTLPDAEVKNETDRITEMLESGVIDRVHIRKPDMSAKDMSRLISGIPRILHGKLSIHSNPEILKEFPSVGWHFSSTRRYMDCSGLHSRSCHSPAEAAQWADRCDYVTLSPVFDSISKPGYLSACFNPVEEFLCCQYGKVVALGGVTPERLPRLKERGYYGAAMLG
ncbi:MAG: thiamine phosphate synthase, partial [Muribaculaceae bacterium]|nr:thiamine phosphate synthase [Muribaculaceae bacterium]